MFTSIIFTLCFAYALSADQTNMDPQPSLGPVYPVQNNDSLLNFTFAYPTNYGFDKLYVRFTIYDFIGNQSWNPQPYPFLWANFTDSNISLPWVMPTTNFVPGDYIIGCFEWLETDNNDVLVTDTYQCILTRATSNYTVLPIAQPMVLPNVVTDTSAMVTAYYPAELPYDTITITPTMNNTIMPTMKISTSNGTYSNMTTFSYTNLTASTTYTLCFQFNYTNSKINGTQGSSINCTTLAATLSGTTSGATLGSTTLGTTLGGTTSGATLGGTTLGTTLGGTTSGATLGGATLTATLRGTTNSLPGNSANTRSKHVLSNLIIMTTLFIYAFI